MIKMIGVNEVIARLGIGKTKFYHMRKKGEFPTGGNNGVNLSWPSHWVDAYCILYWDLDEPMPELTATTLAHIRACAEQARANDKGRFMPPLGLGTDPENPPNAASSRVAA